MALNRNTRVCSRHWQDGKRKSFDDLPYHWNPTKIPKSRKAPSRRSLSSSSSSKSHPPTAAVVGVGDNCPATTAESDAGPLDQPSGDPQPSEGRGEGNSVAEDPAGSEARGLDAVTADYAERGDMQELQLLREKVLQLQSAVVMSENRAVAAEQELASVKEQAFREFFHMPVVPNMTDCSSSSMDESRRPLTPSTFSIESISSNDSLGRFYTGLPSLSMFNALYSFMENCVPEMMYWNGGRVGIAQPCRPHSLSSRNELFLTLVKLRLGSPYIDLAIRFGLSTGTVSNIFTSWLSLLYRKFKVLDIWPSRMQVDNSMPPHFQQLYPSTRVIIDCTEFPIEKPSDPESQRSTWSSYKNRNTFKLLLGINPAGAITFVSELYGGSVSDNELTLSCGILDQLEPGDGRQRLHD